VNMNIKGYEYICALVANAINSIFNNDYPFTDKVQSNRATFIPL
jgi:hypothetical protein